MTAFDLATARWYVDKAFRNLIAAQIASDKAMAAKAALPPHGKTRKRNATLTARWKTKAEERDRCAAVLERMGIDVDRILGGGQ